MLLVLLLLLLFEEPDAGDITEVDSVDIPQHDLLTAGFPCQSFSCAGEQMGLEDDTNGNLFWEVHVPYATRIHAGLMSATVSPTVTP